MLDSGRNQMPAFRLSQPGGSKDGEIVGLRTAAREDHFTWLTFEQARRAIAGFVQRGARPLADVVNARRIAPNRVEIRQHRVPHRWI
jgi:hypothetical protein